MKSHPKKTVSEWFGQHSADPPDRIDVTRLAQLRNGYCDMSGRIIKSQGTSIIATAASWGIVATDARTNPRSLHVFQGRVGQNPDARMLAVVGDKLVRSRANDLMNRWDDITFPAEITTPDLDIAAAGVFRNEYFYHQNGADVPFRVKCEEDDPSATLTNDAEVMGLRTPTYTMAWDSSTAGQGKRFPPDVKTCYCVTFVYGTRGESGPSPMLTFGVDSPIATTDEQNYEFVPLGPAGCTSRRIYRSEIGRGAVAVGGDTPVIDRLEKGPTVSMFLVYEIPDNTTTTWIDKYDNASLDYLRRVPRPRPFVPIARYQIMHLDRLFWGKIREHPWVVGVMYDKTRTDIAPTNYAVTISNTGNGTITFEKDVGAGLVLDFDIDDYKTKTLRTILGEMLGSPATFMNSIYANGGVAAMPAAGLDLDRTYTFEEIVQRAIFDSDDVYWFVAIDDPTTQGTRWFPNRFMWSDITFPEQVSFLNSDDLTRYGSKRITNLILMDNTPVVETDTDSWLIPGSFIPDSFGIPSYEIHRSQASHGSICTRPDACTTVPNKGILMVANDALRNFRGESSDLAGLEIRDVFTRVLREPVCRDHLSGYYYAGEVFIALPTYEIR